MFIGTLHPKKTIIHKFHGQTKRVSCKLCLLKFPDKIALLPNEYKWLSPPTITCPFCSFIIIFITSFISFSSQMPHSFLHTWSTILTVVAQAMHMKQQTSAQDVGVEE